MFRSLVPLGGEPLPYVLAFLLLAVCAFILLLFRFRLTPQAFLYRVISRVARPPESLRPVVRDAPYRRLRLAEAPTHAPFLLNLQTSDGSGQACHPDVLYIPAGFGPERWPYWMVCTPYPYADSSVENPEIFVSRDAVSWAVPAGLRNPLVPAPKTPGDHNSDPDLLFHDAQLWLFYRTTRRGKTPGKTPDHNQVYVMTSPDGLQWSTPTEILSDATGAQLLSPSVLHDGKQFLMWTVEVRDSQLTIARRTSADGLTWSSPAFGQTLGLPSGRSPWHIDVIEETDRLSAILVSCTGLGGAGARIHYAASHDRGLTWSAGDFLLPQAYEFEASRQYRASFRKLHDDPHEYELWYSASSPTDMFSIAYTRLLRVGDTVAPGEARPAEIETLTFAK